MKLRVATRGSKLSLVQVKIAMNYLANRLGEAIDYELVVVRTKGDEVLDRPISQIGVKGAFEKEVNRAVLDNLADVAVHSLKDLPGELSEGLAIVAVPPRDPPNDSLVFGKGKPPASSIEELPEGSSIGTASVRRSAFVLARNPNVKVKLVRGNVDTRVRKLTEGEVDYLILAEAGLLRLGIEVPRLRLPLDYFPPEPGQGLIAVVAPEDSPIAKRLSEASDPLAMAMAMAEREFVRTLRAGCGVPVGGVSEVLKSDLMTFIAGAASPEGASMAVIRIRGERSRPEDLGRRAAEELKRFL
ncbi:MAG: hydroxymethylbilane synthase [Acidilobus sp.]